MQRAEADKLRPGADPMALPVVPIQVFQERNTLFESFEILPHMFPHTSQRETKDPYPRFPAEDGG
jgi:hypothetical protein